jgi:biotin transport system substrate-specific component
MGQALLGLAGTVLLAISAKVQIPFWPVPMTMQTFVVLVLGIVYGSRLGLITGILYLAEGAIGLPVFAKGAGLAYLLGPTGGYLVGFALAMYVVGLLAERQLARTYIQVILVMLVGEAIIFVLGVGWLASIIGIEKAIMGGLVPFLQAELFKIALATVTVPLVYKRLEHKK